MQLQLKQKIVHSAIVEWYCIYQAPHDQPTGMRIGNRQVCQKMLNFVPDLDAQSTSLDGKSFNALLSKVECSGHRICKRLNSISVCFEPNEANATYGGFT